MKLFLAIPKAIIMESNFKFARLIVSSLDRYKEQSARMMGHLISNAPRLIRPYTEPVLRVLVPKLKEPPEISHPAVTLSVLEAIGELATVSGPEMVKWMKELLPIILEILSESSGKSSIN